MNFDVFISCASEDERFVNGLAVALQKEGCAFGMTRLKCAGDSVRRSIDFDPHEEWPHRLPPSGLCVPSAPQGEGYYAALATPIQGANNVSYKPPYSFTGLGVGLVHNRRGQLVYDTQSFNLNPSFSPDTFTPPTGYTQLPAQSPPINATKFNCAVCHASDPPHKVTLYVPQIKKPQPTGSKTAEK